ncbi:MAG: FecR family protein [Candidatus Woesearchaeota archaeon]
MQKKSKFIIAAVVTSVILILLGAYYITSSPETIAYLNIEKGKVEFNSGNGWQIAQDQMKLKENYAIRTLEDGQASVIFYESEILELQPNTEINLTQISKQNIEIEQKKGESWSRVSKLTGTKQYEIKTPNSVATVRGTGFGVFISQESDELLVDEGVVECSFPNKTNTIQTREFKICKISRDKVIEEEITKEHLILIRQKVEKSIILLKTIQLREIKKNKVLLRIIKGRYNATDEDVVNFIEDINTGEIDLEKVKQKIPFRARPIEKIIMISEKINALNKRLEIIDNKIASME